MTSTPDPKAVREIARTFLTDPDADELKYVVRSYIGYAGGAEHEAWCDAVRADAENAMVTTTASWPDEQLPDDGTLNAAYRERAHLVALLAAVYPSHVGCTDPNAPGWAVVTIRLPTGQAAWHIAPDDETLFQHVEQEPENAIPWDGHSTEEKYRRIDELTARLAEADEPDSDVMAVPRFEIEQLERDEHDGDVRAVAQLREELALVSDQAEHAIDLLARTIGSTPCRLDSWGDCDAHGFQGIETGEQCPHALARAFLAGAGLSIAALEARDAKAGEQR